MAKGTKGNSISNQKKSNETYGDIVARKEFEKRFKAVRNLVHQINNIVYTGPKGGLPAMTAVLGTEKPGAKYKDLSVQPVSSREVGRGGYIQMSKSGALAARKKKVLRGTQNTAK